MAIGKDDPQVIEFLTLFARLRDMIDDDPVDLPKLADGDKALTDLCLKLLFSAGALALAERKQRQAFAAPVDPSFIKTWRDYEERYDLAVADVFFADFKPDGQTSQKTRLEIRWEQADEPAGLQARAIQGALDFAEEEATDQWRGFLDDFRESIREGISAWEALAQQTGFDLRGVFMRRELIPFVLVPRHVASHHGPNEPLSLLTLLQQAHEAFVFGVPFAAVALMRSVLEITLRDHYHAQGSEIGQFIENCRGLPVQVNRRQLHRLRHLANDILHAKKSDVRFPPDMEKELLQLLHVLRSLIEAAPGSRSIR